MNKQTQAADGAELKFRTFGAEGPAYEILSRVGTFVRVRVLQTGEVLDYPLKRAEQDPAA